MSESAIEQPEVEAGQHRTEVYTAETLAALAEEQQLSDNAEQAVEALLLALLLQGAASVAVASTPAATSALRHLLAPVLYPFVIGVGMTMLRRSGRRDVSDWGPLANRVIDRTAEQLADALDRERERQRTKPKDMYERDFDGPANVDQWARQMANTAVTTADEGMKEGLRQRLGFTYKRWLTRMDSRVRDSHRSLEGVVLEAGEKFKTNSGAELLLPGDRRAPISEWINCRCRVLWLRGSEA